MRTADIIETKNGEGYYKQRNKILLKYVVLLFVIEVLGLFTLLKLMVNRTIHQRGKNVMIWLNIFLRVLIFHLNE
jgi:hypothetical protein